jgi:hypothetical protein
LQLLNVQLLFQVVVCRRLISPHLQRHRASKHLPSQQHSGQQQCLRAIWVEAQLEALQEALKAQREVLEEQLEPEDLMVLQSSRNR